MNAWRSVSPLGAASVIAYLAVVATIEASDLVGWQSLAASPAAIAHGRLWLLLTSGLVVEGLPVAQLVVLAVVLAFALARLGAAHLWAVALAAHVGAALVAYAGVGVLWLIDATLVAPREPDYGTSVVMAGELGALAARGGRRAALVVGVASLAGFGVGLVDSSTLANAEHVLGFAIGALAIAVLDRDAVRRAWAAS
jgi:hypothetical protein